MSTKNGNITKINLHRELLFDLSEMTKESNHYSFAKKLMLANKEGKVTESQYFNLIEELQVVCSRLGIDYDSAYKAKQAYNAKQALYTKQGY